MKEESKKTSKLYSLFFIPIVFVFLFEIVFLKIDDERFINFLENLIFEKCKDKKDIYGEN